MSLLALGHDPLPLLILADGRMAQMHCIHIGRTPTHTKIEGEGGGTWSVPPRPGSRPSPPPGTCRSGTALPPQTDRGGEGYGYHIGASFIAQRLSSHTYTRFRVSAFDFRFLGVIFRVSDFGSRALGSGFRVQGFYLAECIYQLVLESQLPHKNCQHIVCYHLSNYEVNGFVGKLTL